MRRYCFQYILKGIYKFRQLILLTHIPIDAMDYHEIGTNDNLGHNTNNNKDEAHADVSFSYHRLCYFVDGGKVFSGCLRYPTLHLQYI